MVLNSFKDINKEDSKYLSLLWTRTLPDFSPHVPWLFPFGLLHSNLCNLASFSHRLESCTCTHALASSAWASHTHEHIDTQRLKCCIEHARMCPLTDRKAAETAGSLWWGGLWTPAVSGSVCSSPCEGSPAAASSSPPQTWHPADREREGGGQISYGLNDAWKSWG